MVNANALPYLATAVTTTMAGATYYFGNNKIWKYDLNELKEDLSEVKKDVRGQKDDLWELRKEATINQLIINQVKDDLRELKKTFQN